MLHEVMKNGRTIPSVSNSTDRGTEDAPRSFVCPSCGFSVEGLRGVNLHTRVFMRGDIVSAWCRSCGIIEDTEIIWVSKSYLHEHWRTSHLAVGDFIVECPRCHKATDPWDPAEGRCPACGRKGLLVNQMRLL